MKYIVIIACLIILCAVVYAFIVGQEKLRVIQREFDKDSKDKEEGKDV